MATSLPWSVKGVDPRTRDAAKAAARRAGMTLGEWLDHKIRVESHGAASDAPEQLDIAALSERLARLSQGQMETSSQAAASAAPARSEPSQPDFDAVISQAAATERLTRESSAKTAGALDSIARWIENTEHRMTASERAAAERQERATAVIADAIKTMGERIVDVERKAVEGQRKSASVDAARSDFGRAEPARAPRLAFSRDGLAAAVTDIRTRQRALDSDRMPQASSLHAAQRTPLPEARVAALRQDLRDLSARIAPAAQPAEPSYRQAPSAYTATAVAYQPAANPIEHMVAELGARLDRLDRRDGLDPVLKPLARIESEMARLAQDRAGDSYQRVELEIAHLAAKVDALAARGGDRSLLAPVMRDIGELRDMMAQSTGDRRLEDVSHQIASLSSEMGRLRDVQPDGRELRSLALAIEDVRDAILADRTRNGHADPAPMNALARQIEGLASRIDALPTMRPELIDAQAEQLAARIAEMDLTGRGVSGDLSQRIETLVGRLEGLAERQPDRIEGRLDALQQRIETLVEQGPAAVTRQIATLADRIETLAASSNLTQVADHGGAMQIARVDLRPVEDMLRALADKIDEAGRPGAENDAFDALEQQISGLAARLDEAAATRSAESGIERTLQDLVGHLQTLREETTQAVQRAAGSDRTATGSGIAELSHLVSGLRDTHVSSGRETQDAIGAVHQTLETIISRLASLEADLAADRQNGAPRIPMPPRAALQAQPAPVAMPKARELGARDLDRPEPPAIASGDRLVAERQPRLESGPGLSLDLPLEPGSGRPRPDASAASGQDPQSIRQSLIAAARRSAKAATEAAAATPAAATEKAPKTGGRLKEIMEKRKRPMLLGLAALVLAIGTAHVVTGALTGDKAVIPGAQTVETPAAEPYATPTTEPPPRDQSSEAAPTDAPATASATLAPALPSIAGPALAAATSQEVTGSTGQGAAALALPPATPPSEPVAPATQIGDLPPGLGGPGVRKAALAGDARAVYELAARAADGPGAARDPKLALRLFERAAVAGLTPAQFRLGNMFEKGIGTQRDIALAQVWYTRAAERGNAKAMHNLAVLHAEGVSGKPDYATATEWFRKAADLGVRDSQYNLAVLLGRGLGVAADLGQSYLWFSVAAGQGDEDAAKKRDEVAQRLTPADLSAAKTSAERWRPRPLNAEANEVAPPVKGWDETPTAANKKPAKPSRS
jgi:localization factor PodJL